MFFLLFVIKFSNETNQTFFALSREKLEQIKKDDFEKLRLNWASSENACFS